MQTKQITAKEFNELVQSGKLVHIKNRNGGGYRATSATFGQLLKQEVSHEPGSGLKRKKIKLPKPEAKQLSQMKLTLTMLKVEFISEYQFFKERKWRADIYIPSMNVLIEYEGVNSKKSRHTSLTGYSKDTEKYNKAAELGFRVIRYTVLTYENMIHDLKL